MTCFYCKGNMKNDTTTYMTSLSNCYIIIKNVPCHKCTQCGEESIDGETALKIEKILEKLKSVFTEVAIVDFSKAA